jgi:transposase
MFSFAPEAAVYLHRQPVDFRKQIDGLAILVQQSMALSPMQEALFVFTNRRADRIKVLWWDRNGFCLWTKRLEQDRFAWPFRGDDDVLTMDGEQLAWLLAGFDVFRFPPHQRLSFGAVI